MNRKNILLKGLTLLILTGTQVDAKVNGFDDALYPDNYEIVKEKTEKGKKKVDKNLMDFRKKTEAERAELRDKQQAIKVRIEDLVTRIKETNSKLTLIIATLQLNEQGLMNCFSKRKNTEDSLIKRKEKLLSNDENSRQEVEKLYNKKFKTMQSEYTNCLDKNSYERTKLVDIQKDLKSIKHDIDFADDDIGDLETEQKNILTDLQLIQSKLKLIEDGKYDELK